MSSAIVSSHTEALFTELESIAQKMLSMEQTEKDALRTRHLLSKILHTLDSADRLETIQANGFLQTAALIMFHTPDHPEIVASCTRICGHLIIVNPNSEFAKSASFYNSFATPLDLIYITRICMSRAYMGHSVRKVSKTLALLTDLLRHQQAHLKIPNVFNETFEYVIGTLEYCAFLPQEIAVTGEDFMPGSFLEELEHSMSFYPVMASYRKAV